jgi:hypothetical protein
VLKRGDKPSVYWKQVGEAETNSAQKHRRHRQLARLECRPPGCCGSSVVGRCNAPLIASTHSTAKGQINLSRTLRGRRGDHRPPPYPKRPPVIFWFRRYTFIQLTAEQDISRLAERTARHMQLTPKDNSEQPTVYRQQNLAAPNIGFGS